MRARLQRDYRFEAAHFLPFAPAGHQCSRVHGHSYLVSIAIEGEIDPVTGWVMDFAAINEQMLPVIARLDHRLLNDIDGLANPTRELLAAWLWMQIERLPGLAEVHICETMASRCIYRR